MGVRRSDRHPCLTSRPQPSMAARTPMRQGDVLGDRDGRGLVPAWLTATPMPTPTSTPMRQRPGGSLFSGNGDRPARPRSAMQSRPGFRGINQRHDPNACRDVVAPGVGPSGTWMCHDPSTDRTSARGVGQPPGRRRPLPEPAPPASTPYRFNASTLDASRYEGLKGDTTPPAARLRASASPRSRGPLAWPCTEPRRRPASASTVASDGSKRPRPGSR